MRCVSLREEVTPFGLLQPGVVEDPPHEVVALGLDLRGGHVVGDLLDGTNQLDAGEPLGDRRHELGRR